MKNKYLKGAHISERKFRMLLKLFCEDLTATQIANISGVSRITINSYLKLIRIAIAQFCEKNSPHHLTDLPSFISGHLIKQPEVYALAFGIFKADNGIYTHFLHDIDKATMNEIIRCKKINDNAGAWHNRLKHFNGIANFNSNKLIRINNSIHELPKGKSQIDEIDFFWGLIKGRLTKFRGMNTATLYLHVKESEFRYNHRNKNIFDLLCNIIEQQPLQYSKVVL